jgi:hypothetical protein
MVKIFMTTATNVPYIKLNMRICLFLLISYLHIYFITNKNISVPFICQPVIFDG